MADDKQAKVDIILNVNNALANIDKLQKRLDSISLKRLNTSNTNQLFNGLNQNTDKAIRKIESLRTAYVRAVREMRTAMDKNRTSFTFQQTDEFKGLVTQVNSTKRQLIHIVSLFDKLHQSQKDVINQSTIIRIGELNTRLKLTIKNTEKLITKFEKLKGVNIDGLFTNLSNSVNKIDIARINDEAKKLQATLESVSNTANSIDNSIGKKRVNNKGGLSSKELTTYYHPDQKTIEDYFMVRFRSGIAKSAGTYLENYLTNIIPNTYNSISRFEQNRVNFAQVMPDEIANKPKIMNEAMSGFIDIASKYGTSVQEVTEAGRLWGRQYKDVATVQTLVNESTKLSITDNMSLLEVNKALEATMQQYNIRLKDANEAEQVASKIVDIWAKSADTAVVTAQDMAMANEQSAGAAYQAGISFEYLQAMIATMSTTTGKRGAEVGRAIRSMLVSMNSNKAKQFFNELGIATTTLEGNKVKVRSFEYVLDDLMKKLQNYPKDASKIILAMSGGKYQYNNIMALVKAYPEMQKNLANFQTASGWANQQVGLQQETLTRTVQSLQAELERLVITLDKVGATSQMKDLVSTLKEMAVVIGNISPENFNTTIELLQMFLVSRAFYYAPKMFKDLGKNIESAKNAGQVFSGTLYGIHQRTISLKTAMGLLGATLSKFSAVLTVLQAGYMLFEAYYDTLNNLDKEAIENSKEKTKSILDQCNVLKENSGLTEKQSQRLIELNSIINNSKYSTNEQTQAIQELNAIENQLTETLGKSSVERMRSAGYTKEAIESERKKYIALQIAQNATLKSTIESELLKTKEVLNGTNLRLKAKQRELEIEQALVDYRTKSAKETVTRNEQWLKDNPDKKDTVVGNVIQWDLENAKETIEKGDINITHIKASVEQLQAGAKELQTYITSLENAKQGIIEATNNAINGIDSPDGDNENNSKKGNTSTGSTNYNQQTARTEYQLRRNNLWYEGSIQAKQYNNALKEITNNEELYGKTLESIKAKGDLFEERSIQLKSYEADLKVFKDELIADLDKMMIKNTELANKVGWRNNLTEQEKLKNIEVNKELYQQVKTYSELVNMINQTVQKLEDVKTKQIDIANQAKKNKEEHLQEQLDIITRQYEDLVTGQKGTYVSDTQKDRDRLNYLYQLKALQEQSKNEAYKDWLDSKNDETSTEQDIAGFRRIYEEKLRIVQETNAQIRDIENQGIIGWLDVLRGSMQANFSNMLLQGTSFKEAMKNIWNDLCSYIVQELIKVYIVEQLTGLLFKGLTGGGSGADFGGDGDIELTDYIPKKFEFTDKALEGWESYAPWKLHTGSSIGSYPKMHSGGAVARGRAGVNPKLKSDEVVRTLQVGEEVNSIKDRRSNEIMAMVAMKAMEKDGNQPQNITINALDSRSFAEYLNDNADILTAVLTKQGALGRR